MIDFHNDKNISVQILDQNNEYYSAILDINKSSITLDIYAESNEKRHLNLDYLNMTSIECRGFGKTYVLYGLQLRSHSTEGLSGSDSQRAALRVQFYASSLIAIEASPYFGEKVIEELEIESEVLEQWIGTTSTQQKIPSLSVDDSLAQNGKALKEFEVSIGDLGHLSLKYKRKIGGIDKFIVGMSFPPRLTMQFKKAQSFEEALCVLNKLKHIMSFIVGRSFECKVHLKLPRRIEGFFFQIQSGSKSNGREVVLYPLLHNSIDPSFAARLPPFDVLAFDRFFNLSTQTQCKWDKYLCYKNMENSEERYLGYFRLLESLIYKEEHFLDPSVFDEFIESHYKDLAQYFDVKTKRMKDFLRYIGVHVNPKKYNVERSLNKLYRGLPLELRENLKYKQSDIRRVVSLRNDITHARSHSIETSELDDLLAFLEALLILEMYKEIGIDYEVSMWVVTRMNQFVRIRTL
ncbi:HEPN domain-containing protein [Vibrio coralliilyticus]|uniref:ApeA N-terminal domain-containing protein n=1 Tax=Vibrio coralliilyticus TaxID=190893 RepID=A0AAP6ZQ99_9VIBR|nr:hypothetical protein [Vibrio coralliilyticus]